MSSLIKNLQIKNFKSVRDLSLECDRINIFIGKPNAGKSNILEAISLLGFPYPTDQDMLKNLVRLDTVAHLFHRFESKKPIEIDVNGVNALHLKEGPNDHFDFLVNGHLPNTDAHLSIPSMTVTFNPDGSVYRSGRGIAEKGIEVVSSVKRYEFKGLTESKMNGTRLATPNGSNFYSVIESHPELQEEIQQFLKPNGLELLLDIASKRMFIVQRSGATLISFPLHLVPDTFQRYIFHLAAIMSNRDSVLLFEEPESHSYAPYVYQLAQHILDDEGGNQYFITTHNPYLLTPILQEGKDVALFVTWFEDYQTHARRLSEEEVGDILNYGIDIFLNLKHFIPE